MTFIPDIHTYLYVVRLYYKTLLFYGYSMVSLKFYNNPHLITHIVPNHQITRKILIHFVHE